MQMLKIRLAAAARCIFVKSTSAFRFVMSGKRWLVIRKWSWLSRYLVPHNKLFTGSLCGELNKFWGGRSYSDNICIFSHTVLSIMNSTCTFTLSFVKFHTTWPVVSRLYYWPWSQHKTGRLHVLVNDFTIPSSMHHLTNYCRLTIRWLTSTHTRRLAWS